MQLGSGIPAAMSRAEGRLCRRRRGRVRMNPRSSEGMPRLAHLKERATRRGTHVRADATGPCRGCATAVSCRAASCMSRRPCPRPVCCAHCTSVAQTCRAALRVTRQLLPRSPTDVPAPSGQRRRRIYPNNCYKRAEAVRGGDRDQIARLPWQRTHICHRRRLSRRTPAAASGTRASHMHSTRKMQLACSQAHPNWPAEAALSASRV